MNILRSTVDDGTKNLVDLVQVIKEEQGVAFFKNLTDAGRVATNLNSLTPEAMFSLKSLLSQATSDTALALSTVLKSAKAGVFLQSVTDVKAFASVLESMGSEGSKVIEAILGGVDPQGAKFLGEIMSTVKDSKALGQFLAGLEKEGQTVFAGLISGNMSEAARAGIVSTLSTMTEKGAGVLSNILNKVSGVDVMRSLFDVLGKEEGLMLVVCANGYGKLTKTAQFTKHARGGVGIKAGVVTAKTGEVVDSRVVHSLEDDLLIISKQGQVIRLRLKDISIIGRATQGVRIMKLKDGDFVASLAMIDNLAEIVDGEATEPSVKAAE
jgi:DNA gyrase/topoisomerase IV subunit A